jgi:hypothetical protein
MTDAFQTSWLDIDVISGKRTPLSLRVCIENPCCLTLFYKPSIMIYYDWNDVMYDARGIICGVVGDDA